LISISNLGTVAWRFFFEKVTCNDRHILKSNEVKVSKWRKEVKSRGKMLKTPTVVKTPTFAILVHNSNGWILSFLLTPALALQYFVTVKSN